MIDITFVYFVQHIFCTVLRVICEYFNMTEPLESIVIVPQAMDAEAQQAREFIQHFQMLSPHVRDRVCHVRNQEPPTRQSSLEEGNYAYDYTGSYTRNGIEIRNETDGRNETNYSFLSTPEGLGQSPCLPPRKDSHKVFFSNPAEQSTYSTPILGCPQPTHVFHPSKVVVTSGIPTLSVSHASVVVTTGVSTLPVSSRTQQVETTNSNPYRLQKCNSRVASGRQHYDVPLSTSAFCPVSTARMFSAVGVPCHSTPHGCDGPPFHTNTRYGPTTGSTGPTNLPSVHAQAPTGPTPVAHAPRVFTPPQLAFQPPLQNSASYLSHRGPSHLRLSLFSGAVDAKGTVSFSQWLSEVRCLMRCEPEATVSQAIRQSLRSPASDTLLYLGETASISQILEKFQTVYGNVLPLEQVLEKFYTARQSPSESVVQWSTRLEALAFFVQVCIFRL